MVQALENLAVADGDPVRTEHITTALTAGSFAYDDGATQTFEPGGGTTYAEHGQRSHGEWYVDSEGRFCSFWPPSYRACYDLHWIVGNENRCGITLRFTVVDIPSIRSTLPTVVGFPPNLLTQVSYRSITTGSAPRCSSAGEKSRPSIGATPSNPKALAVTSS